MDPLRIALLILHISAAAMLLGVPTGMTRNLRSQLRVGGAGFQIAAEDAVKRGRLTGISALITMITGFVLILHSGGFGVVGKNFHAALTVLFFAIVLGFGFMKPTAAKLLQVSKSEPFDQQAAESLIKKLGAGTGILHGLWIVTLTLMFVRF